MIDEKAGIIVKRLYDNNYKQLSDSIKFLESSDTKSNEILIKMGNFYIKVGKLMDS